MHYLTPARAYRHWSHRPGASAAALAVTLLLVLVLVWLPLRWSFVLIAAAGLLILLVARPALGLAAVAFAIPFGSLAPLPVPGANAVDALVALAVIAWLARSAARRELRLRLPPLGVCLLVFVWLAAASLAVASSWREGLPELLKWVEFAALYVAAAHLVGEDRKAGSFVLAALLIAGTLQAAIGAYQFFRQVGPEGFVLLRRFMRAYGTLRQPNPYAGYLGYLVPVALSLAVGAAGLWLRGRSRRHLALAIAAAGAAAALAGGIIMSWSRGAWLGLGAAAVAVLAVRNRWTALGTAGAVAALAIAVSLAGTAWLPGPIAGRLSDLGGYVAVPDPAQTEITDANFSVLERVAHWQAGWRMFSDHPWLGVGIGNFAVNYPRYAPPHWYEPLGHAHNAFVNFLAETGILGGLSFGVFWIGIGWAALRAVRRRQALAAALAIGLFGTWVYLTVHSLFDNLFVQHLQLQLALLLGVTLSSEAVG